MLRPFRTHGSVSSFLQIHPSSEPDGRAPAPNFEWSIFNHNAPKCSVYDTGKCIQMLDDDVKRLFASIPRLLSNELEDSTLSAICVDYKGVILAIRALTTSWNVENCGQRPVRPRPSVTGGKIHEARTRCAQGQSYCDFPCTCPDLLALAEDRPKSPHGFAPQGQPAPNGRIYPGPSSGGETRICRFRRRSHPAEDCPHCIRTWSSRSAAPL